jgi:hypothetical protein
MKLLKRLTILAGISLAGCGDGGEESAGTKFVGTWQCTGTEKSDVTVEIRVHEQDFMLLEKGPNSKSSIKVSLETDGRLFFKMGGLSYTINDDGTLQCAGLGCSCDADPYKKAG